MFRRSRAREVALQVLFQHDANAAMARKAVEAFVRGRLKDKASIEYALRLADGVVEKRDEIDGHLAAASENWKVVRMPVVDRNVLRLGTFELLARDAQTPPPIVIDEAIELARRYGSADSPKFVNGVLDKIHRSLPPATD